MAEFKVKIVDCLDACSRACFSYQAAIQHERKKTIYDEMHLPPFLGLFDRAAKTEEEAEKRIKTLEKYQGIQEPGAMEKIWYKETRALMEHCQHAQRCCDYVTLSDGEMQLIGYHLG